MRNLNIGVAVLLSAMLASTALAESDHVEHRHKAVRIKNGSIHPKVQRIASDDAIGWLNYSDKIAKVSFDADVVEKMLCLSPSGFRVTGSRLESPRIHGQQFASVCRLEAGQYAYRVELHDGIGTGGLGLGRSFEGQIIVE